MESTADSRMARMLREAREAACRTQEHLAEEAGVSVQTVRRAEQTGRVGDESIRALCSVLGLEAEELRRRAGAAPPSSVHARIAVPDSSAFVVQTRSPLFDRINIALCFMEGAIVWKLMSIVDPDMSIGSLVAMAFGLVLCLGFMDMFSMTTLCEMRNRLTWTIAWALLKVSPLLAFAMAMNGFGPDVVDAPRKMMAVMMTMSVQNMAFALALQISHDRDRARYVAAALHDVRSRMPGIMEGIRVIVEAQPSPENAVRLRGLVVEAVRLLHEADVPERAEPLILLEEDVARGVSGRKALMDYVRLAEAALRETPRSEREEREYSRAMTGLHDRLSAYA